MLIGILHPGSGIGDQLFSYIAARVRAADLGVDFGFVGREFFKGKDFMQLDWGKEVDEGLEFRLEHPTGRVFPAFNCKFFRADKPHFDPDFDFIQDDTIIDGYGAQDTRYFGHRMDDIREWLAIRSNFCDYDEIDDVCVINFRGGEFKAIPELFLTRDYWDLAVGTLIAKYDDRLKFEVHTDDPEAAKQMFPAFPVFSGIELNWRSIRHAKHLIISNSAFAIIPALLNENVQEIIAPKYWNRRNIGKWNWPMNYYKKFTYI